MIVVMSMMVEWGRDDGSDEYDVIVSTPQY